MLNSEVIKKFVLLQYLLNSQLSETSGKTESYDKIYGGVSNTPLELID
jgi:hypothetical protein